MRLIALISCLIILFQSVYCESDNEEIWPNPHAAWSNWATEEPNSDTCQCPAAPESLSSKEDAVALMYFKKFANLLFQEKRLQYDSSSMLYKRSLLFRLYPSQLEQLENVKDARDLDILLSNIIENAEAAPLFRGSAGCSYTYMSWIPDIFLDFSELFNQAEVRLFLKFVLALGLVWLVKRRAKVGAISIILGGTFLYGYFITYLECNRKLEVDAMIEVMDNHQGTSDYDSMSWGMRIWDYLSRGSQASQQKDRLRKSAKLNMGECRLDHVFIMYINDLFLKQLEMVLVKVFETMSKLTSEMSFPFNLLAPILLVALMGYIIKLTFKYIISPKAWIPLIHSRSSSAAHQPSIQHHEALGDRISGENLKMLLNTLHITSTQKTEPLPAVSGVQDVIEGPTPLAIKNEVKASNEKLNESTGSNSDRNASSRDNTALAAGFTLIDDPESNDVVDNID